MTVRWLPCHGPDGSATQWTALPDDRSAHRVEHVERCAEGVAVPALGADGLRLGPQLGLRQAELEVECVRRIPNGPSDQQVGQGVH